MDMRYDNRMDQPDTVIMHDMEEARLKKLISYLRPDRELYSGRKFFEVLLEYAGVEGVMRFVRKANQALSDKGELDLYFDFDDVEREAFAKTRLNYMTRRGFCGVFAVGAAGAVFGATGAAGLTRQGKELLTGQRPRAYQPTDDTVEKVEQFIQKECYPTAEVLIGAALLNEAYDKRMEIKLEQIADAVAELHLKTQKEAARKTLGR